MPKQLSSEEKIQYDTIVTVRKITYNGEVLL